MLQKHAYKLVKRCGDLSMYNYIRAAYYLASMIRRAYWDTKKLDEYQNRKVREIVKHAYENVPFYRRKFRELGIKPSDVRKTDDLRKLPLIRRKELVKNSNQIVSENIKTRNLRIVSTSGSTGQPFHTLISRKEDEFRKAKHLRANIAVGQKPRDRWVVVTAPQHFNEISNLQRLFGIYVASPLSVFDDPASQISVLRRLKPDILDGYSSSLYLLAKELEKTSSELVKPRLIIGGAELVDVSSRKFVERVFGCQFYDQYASVEFERLAWQCEEKTLYHIDADSVVMQFVDKEGEQVSPGERGEIVCTSLFNFAMPFIRYVVGDVGVLSDNTECACGRKLPLMKIIEGRRDSFIVLPDGRVLSPLAFGWIMEMFKFYNNIDQYRLIQKRLDTFKIVIQRKDGIVSENEIMNELTAHIRKMLNVVDSEIVLEVAFVDEMPLEGTGKLRKVVSEVEKS